MKKRYIYILFVLLGLIGCVESDIVTRFKAAQVEQLLTNGDIKTWLLSELIIDGERQPISACSDSVRWVFEVIDTDSISSYELRFDSNCMLYDTTFFGAFEASAFETVFTDSLKFEGGNKTFMSLHQIRSTTFTVDYTQSGKKVVATLNETRSDYLARQVRYYLTDGNSSNDLRDWYMTAKTVDGTKQTISTCSDSTIFRFSWSNGNVKLSELVSEGIDCSSYSSSDLGAVGIPVETSEGYFENRIVIEGGEIEEMDIPDFSSTTFIAEYYLDTLFIRSTYVAE